MMTNCPRCSSPIASNGSCLRCLLQVGVELKHASNSVVADDHIPSIEELRQSFPHLEIKRLVGRGGMGAIYQARQTGLDRDVAIKIIDRRISKDGPFLERFEREARALAKLSHPSIVAVYDYGRTSDGLAYLVMEYVNGLNLREAMEAMSIDAREATEYIKTMCGALYYAHSKGVVHRDIKPENILLGDDGSLKIADFGIAKIVDAQSSNKVTATRQVLGTPHYLAPEQLDAPNEVDHRVDIYAVGVVFYELLTHQLPIGTFEAPSQLNPALDRRYDTIVSRSLSRRPTARYQSAEELRLALEATATEASSSIPVAIPVTESAVDSRLWSNVSVPFERDDWAGFAAARGTIQANPEGIQIQYQVCDKILGKFRSKLRTISIPWGRIVRIDIQNGFFFTGKLSILVDSDSALQGFPNSESGRLEVVIQRRSFELVQRLTDKIRTIRPELFANAISPWAPSGTANYSVAAMLVFFAIINAGLLAISEVLCAFHLNGWVLTVAAIASAVLLGPIVVAQLVTGVIYAVTGNRSIANIGVLTTMLPVSPLVPFGLPFGIWAGGKLEDEQQTNAPTNRNQSAKSWGATTLIYMRDSRNARVVSVLETVGCVAVFSLIGIYWFGLYPVTLNMRVVGDIEPQAPAVQEELQKSIEARSPGANYQTTFSSTGRLFLRCWQFQRKSVLEQLALSHPPSLRCLVGTVQPQIPAKSSYLPVLAGIPLEETSYRNVSSGPEVLCDVDDLQLESAWVNKVEWMHSDQLRLVLSTKGDEVLRKFTQSHASSLQSQEQDSSLRMVLVVEGWIEGVSIGSIRDRQITFRIGDVSNKSHTRIQAAIRGPSLPCEFELLD